MARPLDEHAEDAWHIVSDEIRPVRLAALSDGSRHLLVFFLHRQGKWLPLEMRIIGVKLSTQKLRALLAAWRAPQRSRSLQTSDLRDLRLSEARHAVERQDVVARSVEALTLPIVGTRFSLDQARELGLDRVLDLDACIQRLRASQAYADEVRVSGRPMAKVASVLGLSEGQARNVIAMARKDGFLTSTAPGMSGGQITEKAVRFSATISDLTRGLKGKENSYR